MRILLICLALLSTAPARAENPVVVELYTSQGCSSCPPADALLTELAAREDVIALSLHVDYWDYIGWADTFASAQFSQRQSAYARAVGERMVYTPQMIVAGAAHVVASEPMRVADMIYAHRNPEYPVSIRFTRDGGELVLEAEASMAFERPEMVVQIVTYRPHEEVEIGRGENAGRVITYTNIVTNWAQVGEWDGQAPFALRLADQLEGQAVAIVQLVGPGPILGAARLGD